MPGQMTIRGYFHGGSALVATMLATTSAHAQVERVADYNDAATRIIQSALADSNAWNRLAYMTDTFGPRLSGSDNLERAITWMLSVMEDDGLINVRGEPAMVPHWVRGRESVDLILPRETPLAMLGLGGSVGTPPEGISAEVLVVSSFEELTERAAEARGKIVLFDVPFTNYGATVRYRGNGAVAAARVGAVAALIRSVTPVSLNSPHTGAMNYDSTTTRIPAAALSVEGATMLHRMQDRGQRVVLRLRMEARTLPDVPSRNVVAELKGREYPEEVVVLGGHIDSWDVGQGAMDDGGGVVVSWEALRVLKRLGLQPRRTIRVVGWTNEENGLRGGNAYRDRHATELDDHILAIESDGGVFEPRGFGFSGTDEARAIIIAIGELLAPLGASSISNRGGGADIGPIMREGVPGVGHQVDGTKYFWYHHSHADTMDKLDPREMAMNVAAMAILAYVVADLPERLPRQ
jgi:carboxypeptidase Q